MSSCEPAFVGRGSGAPEVRELLSAWGCNWAVQPQGVINSGVWPLGVGHMANVLTLENTSCCEISNKSELSEKAKTHKGL
jgi:hypothetical protein